MIVREMTHAQAKHLLIGGEYTNEHRAYEQPNIPVLISSAICGGTLKERLEEAFALYASRAWLFVEPLCCVFPLPCLDGVETAVSLDESYRLREQFAEVYTPAFCCNYCVDIESEPARLHLFDTKDTITQKLQLAQELGFSHAIVLPHQ